MTTRYEVVRAKDREEAASRSAFKTGQLVRVSHVEIVGNGDGTFSVFPIVEPLKEQAK